MPDKPVKKPSSKYQTSTFTRDATITEVIGTFPYRMALAGGWIDQPFISKHDSTPPGSMVVVSLQPTFHFVDRCGMATSTRKVAFGYWGILSTKRELSELVRELYKKENQDAKDPSGSQDMVSIIYPGISRIDYDHNHEGGLFPIHVESNNNTTIAEWIEQVLKVIPIAQRPEGYYPLGIKNLDPLWIQRLGQTGIDCYNAILAQDIAGLGASLTGTIYCWEALLPHIVRHPSISTDLMAIFEYYRSKYAGAVFSGCGGGYLFIASEDLISGVFQVNIRITEQ